MPSSALVFSLELSDIRYHCVRNGQDQGQGQGVFKWLRRLCGLDSYLALVLIRLIQILSAIIAIREHLCVHIQCICRFACFSCDGRIHGTWWWWWWCVCARACVCVCVCVCVCHLLDTRRDTPFHHEFKAARSNARAAIDTAIVDWVKSKAQEATDSRFNGTVVWKCIHDLQSAGRGLQPARTAVIVDENGNVCTSPREQGQRWGRHFSGVLNVMSTCTWTPNALNGIPELPLAENLAELPTLREVCRAVARLKNGKAAGASGVLPEMVKAGGELLKNKLVELFGDVWRRASAAGVGRCYPCANPEESGPDLMRQLARHRAAQCCQQGPGQSHSDATTGPGQQLPPPPPPPPPPRIPMRLSARQILHGHGVQRTSAAREDH